MSFARHQTFYLRSGWLAKALDELASASTPFSGDDAPVRLGIGKNMVQSLRFWVQACWIAEMQSKRLSLTRFGQLVSEYDRYFENPLTWWVIHSSLATNSKQATSWYYLFNEFKAHEFSRLSYVEAIKDRYENEASESSFQKDFDCIIASYASSDKRGSPEENTDCPLRQLGLIQQMGRYQFRKRPPSQDIPIEVLFLIMDSFVGHKSATRTAGKLIVSNVTDLQLPLNIGPIFNLSLDSIYRYLDQMQDKGWVQFSRTAGLDSLIFEKRDPWDMLEKAYSKEKGGAK